MKIPFTGGLVLLAGLLTAQVASVTGNDLIVLLATENISCAGLDDGSARLTLISGASPVVLNWSRVPGGPAGNNLLTAQAPVQILSNLPPGDYHFTLTDANGMDTVLVSAIFEPPPLIASLQVLSDYNGFPVSCADGADGRMTATAVGGTPPYSYTWSSGETNAQAEALQPGVASVLIRDAAGCPLLLEQPLGAPPPIQMAFDVDGEPCLGAQTGRIELVQLNGGLPPYQLEFDGDPAGGQTIWEQLSPGFYFIEVTDANGCSRQDAVILPTGLEFIFDAGPDLEAFTGDTLTIPVQADRPLDSLIVLPAQLAWTDGVVLELYPRFSTTYTVVAIDMNGCRAEDQVAVLLHRNRDVYAPNVFAPDAMQTENRSFTLFGGGGIRNLSVLEVYDRQGRRVFSGKNLPMDQPDQGWNGRIGGELAPAGVYYWQARVLYTDGRLELYDGDVTLLR